MKPINMKTWEVQALLDNRKTVARRVVKPQNKIFENPEFGYTAFTPKGYISVRGGWKDEGGEERYGENFIKLPYQPGDVLYVRETWQEVYETEVDEDTPRGFVNIRERILNFDEIPKVEAGISRNCATATMKPRMKYYVFKASDISYAEPAKGLRWRPSIHMPREAARIFLRLTDVRVERLQDITDDGVEKEGVPIFGRTEKEVRCLQAFSRYPKVWNSIIKPKDRALYGWEADPWVWVIEFEKISREETINKEG